MSSFIRKIRLAFEGKKPEVVESCRFSELESYIDNLRNGGEASQDYSLLIKSYEEFMGNLGEVKAELDSLRENGEKRFTRILGDILNGIGSIDRSDLSSFEEFYDETSKVIASVLKVPGIIQRKTLRYENGRETIEALNSLLKSFRKLGKVRSEVLAEDKELKHYENALKKYRELQEAFSKMKDLQKGVLLLESEMEKKKRKLREATANLQAAKSEIDNKEIAEAKRHVASVDRRMRQIDSDLRLNLGRARRPIKKILHSEDRKLFEFFKRFSNYPLANINPRFWEMISVLEKQNVDLGEKEKSEIDDFLKFCTNRLQDMIEVYENATAEKKAAEEKLNEIISRNNALLGGLEMQQETAQNDFALSSKRLDETASQKNTLESNINKNSKTLEKILSTIVGNEFRIEFD